MAQGIGHKTEARSNNFVLHIGEDRVLTFSAQSANVADIVLGTAIMYTGKKELKIPGNTITNAPLIIDIIVSEDFSEWISIYKWLLKCKNIGGSHLEKVEGITLVTLNSQNQPSTQFFYSDAFPTEMNGIQYSVTDDGSRVMTMTVTFEFNRFIVIAPNGEQIDESYTG